MKKKLIAMGLALALALGFASTADYDQYSIDKDIVEQQSANRNPDPEPGG